MLTYYFRSVKDESMQTLDTPRAGVWVYGQGLTDAEKEQLVSQYDLDPSVLEDASDFYELPRFEYDEGVGYFFTRYPYFDEKLGTMVTSPILFALGPDFLLTVSLAPAKAFEPFLEGKKSVYTTQKVKLFIELMRAVTQSYARSVTMVRRRVRDTATHVDNIEEAELVEFVRFEGMLNDFVSSLVPTNAALTRVLSGKYFQLYEDDIDIVEDLQLANAQLIESCKTILRSMSSIREGYSTITTSRLDKVLRTLTAITVALTFPMVVASFYGMNVGLPIQEEPIAFLIIFGIALGGSTLLWFIFTKLRWV